MALAHTGEAEQLRQKIESRTARIGVIGMGYVGLPLALLFSDQRFRVTGFDIDPVKVDTLNGGGSYIVRIPATEIQAAQQGGFCATSNYSDIAEMDVVAICVPTPLSEFHEPDLSYIRETAKAIAPHLREGQLIILESTTYPGTTEEVLIPILESNPSGLKVARNADGKGFYVAFSPEREDPGNDTVARRDIPKVVGGVGPVALDLASTVYITIFDRTIPVSSPAVAEMTKLLENIYRCVNIALVNELKQLCQRMGIDIFEVIDAARTKPFGFQAFYPGPGLGGHCIPIDPYYLTWIARSYGIHTRFIELAGEINTAMPHHVVDRVIAALNDRGRALRGSRILVLGAAYKPNVDDCRESPAFELMELLQERGAEVSYNDPHVPVLPPLRGHTIRLESTPLSPQVLRAQDCVLVATDHALFDWDEIIRHSSLLIDTRGATRGRPRHDGVTILTA